MSDTFSTLSNASSGQLGCTQGLTNVNCGAATSPGGGGGGGGGGSTPPTTNTTTLTKGDTTIVVESNVNQTKVGAAPGISKLATSPFSTIYTSTQAPKTTSQQFYINTNTANNATWPTSQAMTYDDYGTCANSGGMNANNLGACVSGTGGHGLGGAYQQYRYYAAGVADQELQIWTWGNSYATQYRDVTASGTSPAHQAWSFGGTYTPVANMPISGTVNYTGQWTGTAKTANWVDTGPSPNPAAIAAGATVPAGGGKDMSYNNTWQLKGTSAITADFGAGTLNGTLTPLFWTGLNTNGGYSTVDVANAKAKAGACFNLTGACSASDYTNWQDYNGGYMDTDIKLAGTITTSTASNMNPNTVKGTATLDPTKGWITNSGGNPMYAGFFGVNSTTGLPNEVTGAFAVDGTQTSPNGGVQGINNDLRATLQMSGIFHGQ